MNDFILGTNYWASNAGTAMWHDWSEKTVDDDIKILSENHINYIRVFPLWSDFQPVIPMYGPGGVMRDYCLTNEKKSENPYYLDETMLSRFDTLLDICNKYNVKVIVGLITGWMSGRLFVPPALYDKNLYSDEKALMFEQKFIKGFVTRFRHRKEIYAWDLGNECNCMQPVKNRESAYTWTIMISNAIKANDATRPIMSGMGCEAIEGSWTIRDQGECTDILTTHPYPLWVSHGSKDVVSSIRTLMLPECLNKFHAHLGGRESLVEETGTMGPMICSEDDVAPGFAKVNLMACYATGSLGMMWWCAHEQTNLKTAPYTWSKCEVELGLTDKYKKPKQVLKEFNNFAEWLNESNLNLPKAHEDGVIILTEDQDHWGIAYMTYILARQAKLNMGFTYANDKIPDSNIYLLPSVQGTTIMNDDKYKLLLEKVYNGATLYISNDNGILSEFESFTGVRVVDSDGKQTAGTISLDGSEIPFVQNRRLILTSIGAEVVAECDGNIILSKYNYGSGKVYYLNFPMEKNLINSSYGFDGDYHMLYKHIFEKTDSAVRCDNKYIGITEHYDNNGDCIVIAINYSKNKQKTDILVNPKYSVEKKYMGDTAQVEPYSSCVIKLKRRD